VIWIRFPGCQACNESLNRLRYPDTHTYTHTINVIQLQESITQYIAHANTMLFIPPMYGVCFVTVTEQDPEFCRQQASNASMNCLVWGSSSAPKTNRKFRQMYVFPSSVERAGKHLSISGSRSFYGTRLTSCFFPSPAPED